MKTTMVLTALGIATLIATPAFAQKPQAQHRARNTDAYASAAQQPNSTYTPGHMVGTDPDPSIRSELQRDWATYSTSN